MKKDLTYKAAASRLDEIVRRIEGENPDVDELTDLVKEAVELSKHCREKLTQADKQLTSLMAQLSEDPQVEGYWHRTAMPSSWLEGVGYVWGRSYRSSSFPSEVSRS